MTREEAEKEIERIVQEFDDTYGTEPDVNRAMEAYHDLLEVCRGFVTSIPTTKKSGSVEEAMDTVRQAREHILDNDDPDFGYGDLWDWCRALAEAGEVLSWPIWRCEFCSVIYQAAEMDVSKPCPNCQTGTIYEEDVEELPG